MLDRIPPDRSVSIEREIFPELIGDGLYGIRLEGYWIDIGTPDRFLEANWDILEGRVQTVIGDRLGEPLMVGEGCEISSEAELRAPCVVGRDSRVEPDAVVERSVLLEGCTVGERARVTNSILSGRVTVEPGAELDGAVIGEGESVPAGEGVMRGRSDDARARDSATRGMKEERPVS